jgi:murein DD-endopeptidase MepM/ murein hydrolase activator NlpD
MRTLVLERLQRTGFPQLLAAAALSVAFSPAKLLAAEQPVPQPAAAVATSADVQPAVMEQMLGPGLGTTVRPSHAAPGELFEVELRGEPLASPSFKLAGKRFPMFRVGPGHYRGFGAVPLQASPGFTQLQLQESGRNKRAKKDLGEVTFRIDGRAFEQRTLTVAAHFTSPSRAQRKQMRADAKAFAAAYRVPFGPPLFKSAFAGPRAGAAVNSHFGVRRVFNGHLQSRHMGLDLEGSLGDPIYAANDGVVRMVRKSFAGGDVVLVSHGAGLFTGYYHLSRFDVKAGQRVKKGDLIGLVGQSGRATGPHLHFSAKLGGVSFDPEALFSFDFVPRAPVLTGVGGGP